MDDSVKITISEREVPFGFIGRAFRLQVVEEIRGKRRAAFKDAVSDLPSNPITVASTVSTAIDAHMTSVIVDDSDINAWLSTPEGYFYTFKHSALKANSELSAERITELYDHLGTEEYATLRKYWGRSIDGNRYDDIEQSVRDHFRKAAVEYYGADGNVVKAFGEWLEAGRPGFDLPEAPATEGSDEPVTEEKSEAPDEKHSSPAEVE
jgi:hypothetical protein